MKNSTRLLLLLWVLSAGACSNPETKTSRSAPVEEPASHMQQQARLAGGPCEGCEAIFEYGSRSLKSIDTLPDFAGEGPRVKVTGTVYQPGGKIPAAGVILYVYHTNQQGIYPATGNETGWGKRHGYIRGWMKTDAGGHYSFYTLKPAHYPNRTDPAHIHLTLLEPGGKYYWLGSYLFEGDPLLPVSGPATETRGGGAEVLSLHQEGNMLVGTRDIELGKNIPGYE